MNLIRMRKTALALMLLLVLSSMAACGKTESGPASTPTSAPVITAEPTAAVSDTTSATPKPESSTIGKSTSDYETDGTARVTVDGTSFLVDGKELWINGVNTPWDKWNDFGSMYFNQLFWEDHFAKLEAAGVNASRIWINCNGMVGVLLNSDGSFKEVTAKHWKDLDTLFSIAKKHHIYIMATLLSFDHFKDSNSDYQNWRAMITSSNNIDSFVEGYVIPFVQRYDSCDYLWSVDLVNEPDWIYENKECGQIDWSDISNYFARATAGIHKNSDVLVTVGLGIIKYNSDKYEGNMVSDEYLQSLTGDKYSYVDFYSTHYYYWQKQWFGFPFDTSPDSFGLDGTKPALIGETASLDESGRTITDRYESAYNNGWKGVMAWTSNGVDACGKFEDVEPAVTQMQELIPDLIHPLQ